MISLTESWDWLWMFGCKKISVKWGKEIQFDFKVLVLEGASWNVGFSQSFSYIVPHQSKITNKDEKMHYYKQAIDQVMEGLLE